MPRPKPEKLPPNAHHVRRDDFSHAGCRATSLRRKLNWASSAGNCFLEETRPYSAKRVPLWGLSVWREGTAINSDRKYRMGPKTFARRMRLPPVN
jgi:hypothetical protein